MVKVVPMQMFPFKNNGFHLRQLSTASFISAEGSSRLYEKWRHHDPQKERSRLVFDRTQSHVQGAAFPWLLTNAHSAGLLSEHLDFTSPFGKRKESSEVATAQMRYVRCVVRSTANDYCTVIFRAKRMYSRNPRECCISRRKNS